MIFVLSGVDNGALAVWRIELNCNCVIVQAFDIDFKTKYSN